MGVSEVLLCQYRCLEYKMERLEKLKIQLCFYSRFLIILLRRINAAAERVIGLLSPSHVHVVKARHNRRLPSTRRVSVIN